MLFEHMNSKINAIIKRASKNSIDIARSIDSYASYSDYRATGNNFKLAELVCLGDDKTGFPNSMGVYVIFHKDPDEDTFCAVIGHGIIRSRLASFKKTLIGKSNDYHAGKKAREVDNDPQNYYASWVVLENKTMAAQTEIEFIENYRPKYISQSSAGV